MKPKSVAPETARTNPSCRISGNVNLFPKSTAFIRLSGRIRCKTSQSNARKDNGSGTMANQSMRVIIAVLSRPRDSQSPSQRIRCEGAHYTNFGSNSKMTEGSTAQVSNNRPIMNMTMVAGSAGVTLTSRRPAR